MVPDTVRKWENKGRITPSRTSGGHRRYTEEDVRTVLRQEKSNEKARNRGQRRNIIYCCVPHEEQEHIMMRQARDMEMFALGRRLEVETITEIGDSANVHRPKFSELLSDVIKGKVSSVVIAHEHSLISTGFELLDNVARSCGCEIIVVESSLQTF